MQNLIIQKKNAHDIEKKYYLFASNRQNSIQFINVHIKSGIIS